MKNKSEIRSRLISSIKVILAVGAMIAICTFISKTNQFEAYAVNTVSGLDWNLSGAPKVYFKNTETVFSESKASPLTGKIHYKINGEVKDAIDAKETEGSDNSVIGEIDNDPQYEISNFSLSDGTKGHIKNEKGIATGSTNVEKNRNKATFNLSLIEIESDRSLLSWKVKGSPATKYVKSGVTVSSYSGTITTSDTNPKWKWEQTVNDNSGTEYEGKIISGTSYSFDVTSCRLSDGTSGRVKEGSPLTGTEDTNGDIIFDVSKLTVLGSSVPSILNYDNVEKSLSGDYDDLGIKLSIDVNEVLNSIYNAKANKGLQNVIDTAIEDNKTITLKVKIEEMDEDDVDKKYKDASDKIEDKAKDSKSNAKIANYFDITVSVEIQGDSKDDSTSYPVTDTGETEIKFKYTIPKNVKSKSSSSSKHTRYYRVYMYHSGSGAEKASGDWTSDDSLTFKSSKFSPFATAYYDDKSDSSSSSSSSSRTGSSSIAGARTTTTGGTSSGNAAGGSRTGSGAPKTGDEFNAKLWIYFLVVGVVVALCAFILYQDTKDWRDEKKEAK